MFEAWISALARYRGWHCRIGRRREVFQMILGKIIHGRAPKSLILCRDTLFCYRFVSDYFYPRTILADCRNQSHGKMDR
jgi:hypothetical protein